MIKVEIKVPRGLESRIDETIEAVIPELAEAMRNKIIALAHERLHSSSQAYVDGVSRIDYPYMIGKLPKHRVFDAAVITLVGALPIMIERGWDGGDMKPFLLMGPKAKTSASGGRYNRIPFRHGNPKATGRNFPPMGSQFTRVMSPHEAARLGERVYNEAKRLKPGARLRRRAGGTPILRPHHETDIYSEMQRISGDDKYMTWRTVSDKSHPDAWIHPGITPAKFFDEAASHVASIAPAMFREAFGGE